MTKKFTLWAACALSSITLIPAQEGAQDVTKLEADRERLIDLVLTLQNDFGETLGDYGKLQKDYANLLKRPEIPDQSGKVRELQEKLQGMTAKLEEASQKNAEVDPLILGDLKALRSELHQERAALLVAKAQVAQARKLEEKTKALEKQLETETARGAEWMAQLQTVRGERDALLAKVDGMLKQSENDKVARMAANDRIKVLEKETVDLKEKISQQDGVIAKLKEEATSAEAMAKAVDGLKEEEARLTGMLGEREKELTTLRESLDVEKKRALDVPIMLQAKKELEKRLELSSVELQETRNRLAESEKLASKAEVLENENEALTDKYHQLAGNFEILKTSIDTMEGELVKNRETMVKAMAAGAQVKELELERDQLNENLKTANAKLAGVEEELKRAKSTMDDFKEKLVLAGKEIEKRKAAADEREAILLTAKTSEMEAKKSAEAAVAEANKLKEDSNALALKAAELEKQKSTLATDLASREEDLKALRAEVAKTPKLEEKIASLEEEKKVVAAKLSNELAAQKTLRLELDEAEMLTKQANESVAKASKLKGDYAVLQARADTLEKAKISLTDELKKRDAELAALRAEMAAKPDLTEDLAKLEQEKKSLAAQLAQREMDLKKTRDEMGKLHLSSANMEKKLVALKRSSVEVDPVRYAKGEADVSDQQVRILGQIKEVLEAFPSARFEIVGHTCDLGSKEGNLKLSIERAKSLHDFLASQGIPADRLKFRGVGDTQPMVPNSNEENRRKNRRVEIEILD